MSSIDRRLSGLERIWSRPAEPTGPPCDPRRLSADEQEELQHLAETLEAVNVGPIPLDRRTDIRARLDTLTDEELARLEWLQRKACEAPAVREDR